MRVRQLSDLTFAPKENQARNCVEFLRVMEEFPMLEFFKPSPLASPTHVQCRVNSILVNFWPHRATCHINGRRSVKGFQAMVREIEWAMDQ